MKILFIIPRTKTMFGDDPGEKSLPGYPHVGIAYLLAFLKKNSPSTEIKIYDEQIKGSQNLPKVIKDFKPDLIGITCFTYNYRYFYDLILKIKKTTKIPLILGGPHVSAIRAEVLEETKADLAVKGEGEITILELLAELKKPKPNFKKIKGLIWRQKKEIVENEDRELIKNLDALPFPDFETFGLEQYACLKEKTLPIITSRGCPYGCNYCSVRLSMGRLFRPRSPKNVIDEIKFWYQKGFRKFEINDDCFTLDLKRAEEICDLIVKNKLKINYELNNGIRVDRVTFQLLKKLKKSGCFFITYGCESGNEKILKNIGKGITLLQVRKAVDLTNRAGIKNAVNFIIGHPGETYETAMDSLKFAKSLPTGYVNFYSLVPYPGTKLFDWVSENAKFTMPVENYLRDLSYRDAYPTFETIEFPKEQRIKAIKKGFALYEKTIYQFRLGKHRGFWLFYLTRLGLASWSRNFALNNYFGRKIYFYLSAQSRI